MKGSRKDFYEAETDLAKIVRGRITLSTRWRMDEIRDIIQKSEELIKNAKRNSNDGEERRKIKFYNQRLKEMKRLYKRAHNLLGKFLLFSLIFWTLLKRYWVNCFVDGNSLLMLLSLVKPMAGSRCKSIITGNGLVSLR